MVIQETKQLITVIGISLLSVLCYVTPAKAQLNLSDLGGINIWNSVTPIFGLDSTLSTETINTAESLSQELEEAYQQCQASINNLPRRFARTTASAAEDCLTSECQTLQQLQQEAQQFLNNLDTAQQEQLSDMGLRIW